MTRKEVINQLQDAKDGYEEYLTGEAIDMAIQALEQEPKWISVSERLPEDDYGTYLICTDTGYIATIQYDRSAGWLLDSNIVAWQPLPKPYESQERSDKK